MKLRKLNYENWKLINYLKMEVLKIGILKIKFKNWNSEELFKDEILKINK